MRKNIRYVGLDVHKSFTQAAVLSEGGELIALRKLRTFSEEYYRFFEEISKGCRLEIAFEACSMLRKVVSELETYGKVRVAHPAKVKLIAETKLKSDSSDCLALAKLVRLHELPEVWINRDEDKLRLRVLTRERQRLTWDLVRYKCQIRHLLLAHGIIMEGRIFTKHGRAKLNKLRIQEIQRRLEFIQSLEQEIKIINEEIRSLRYCIERELRVLRSIPGFGLYLSALLASEIGDIARFIKFRKIACYAGLVPITYQSGLRTWHGRITKQGNKFLRWGLVEAANSAIRKDPKLKAFYLRIMRKRGKNKAKVAVAKKLLKLAYTLLKRDEMYRSEA